jgi:hypothetical protein
MADPILVRAELNRILFAMIGRTELVDEWWESANKAFAGKTPNEIYWESEDGRRRVAKYIVSCTESGGS